MVTPTNNQEAHLIGWAGDVIGEIQVPAFPHSPALVKWEGRYFTGGLIGYGVEYITYTEVALYEA